MVTTLHLDDLTARVDDGELIAFLRGTHEYIHQKGSPGWRSSDAEMFPIIGPTAEAGFGVSTPNGRAAQDQHGLLRELDYALVEATDIRAVYEKVYAAGTAVENAKFPAKSTVEHLSWPYDFRFRKTVTLDANGLLVSFEIEGEAGMPFMLGYHPAFRLTSEEATVEAKGESINLTDVMDVGDRAYHVEGCTEVVLRDGSSGAIRLRTEGFGSFMLWSPTANMMCVEPITFYPYDVAQAKLHEGFRTLGDEAASFSVRMEPVKL